MNLGFSELHNPFSFLQCYLSLSFVLSLSSSPPSFSLLQPIIFFFYTPVEEFFTSFHLLSSLPFSTLLLFSIHSPPPFCYYFPPSPSLSPLTFSSSSCLLLPPSLLLSHHLNSLWVEWLYQNSSACSNRLHQFVERSSFDLFPLQVSHTVQEVKEDAALLQLLTEQVMELCHRGIWGGMERGRVRGMERRRS